MVNLDDISVGHCLPTVERRPTNIQLFRFSAVTWNAHRIHYDKDYAKTEDYPDILVQSHLHGCFLAQAALDWTDGAAALRRFRWENRRYAVPGDVLRCTGIVSKIHHESAATLVDIELEERNQDGVLCAPGWATVEFRLAEARERTDKS